MVHLMSQRLGRVAAVGLALGLSASLAQAQRVQVGASETRTRANTRADSLVSLIFTSDAKGVKRIFEEWREREQKLIKDLWALAPDDFPARRRVEDELRMHTRDLYAMMSAVETRCVGGAGPRPEGYLGLNTETSGRRVGTEIRDAVVVVKSVEAGSPAQRAGLRRDDQVLSIGGLLPIGSGVGQLLVPGRSLVVRYVREGQVRESTVVVAPRPDGFGDSCGEIERILGPMHTTAPGILFLEDPQRRVVITENVRPEQPQSTEISVMVFAPTTEDTRATRFFGGAEFRMLTEDWRETLGVKQGVLVNEVAPGSAASQAGLRAGDVITTVGKTPVTSPGAFVQLVATSESPDVQLTLVRQKDKKTVTLRLTQR